MKMYEHFLTVGLFDKDSEKQEITTEAAKNLIAEMLIGRFNIYAFTMIDCNGVYRMESTGAIVKEPSIRIEIAASADDLDREMVYRIIKALKTELNQESIMYKVVESEIDFA